MACVNPNSKEYQDLLREFGDPFDAEIEYVKRYGLVENVDYVTTEATVKSLYRKKGLMDDKLNIAKYKFAEFNKFNAELSKQYNEEYGIPGLLFYDEQRGLKAVPNTEMFHRIDVAKGIYYPENAYIREGYEALEDDFNAYEPEEYLDDTIKTFNEASKFNLDQKTFLDILKRRNDVAPDMFISEDRKYVMNPKGYYNLIEQETNTILFKNIDFRTGQTVIDFQYAEDVAVLKKKKEDAIINISEQVNNNYLDVLLALKDEDINDYIEAVIKAKSSDEIDNVMYKLLLKVC
jgi:hypothetical protein